MKNSAKYSLLLSGIVALSIQGASAFTCPTQLAISSDKIKELSTTGRTMVGDQQVRLTPPTSGKDYKGPSGEKLPVLDSQKKLSIFLAGAHQEGEKISVMGYQATNAEQNECEYSVTVGSKTGRQTGIIALRSDTGAPTRKPPAAPGAVKKPAA